MEVSEKEIKGFFDDIKVVLGGSNKECIKNCEKCTTEVCKEKEDNIEKKEPGVCGKERVLTKSVNDKSGEQRTNVIYLNTDCNLRCEYCYEHDSRVGLPDQADCTPEKIDEFLNEINGREDGRVSTIVLMGGEPLLRFDLVEYTILKAAQLKKNGGFGVSIVTNATLFTDEMIERYKKIFRLGKVNSVYITLDISYDVSGQYRRKWPDGSNSKDTVEKAIEKLIKNNIVFRISYTCHSGNYKNLLEDCIYILERFPEIERLLIGYAYMDLRKVIDDSFSVKPNFTPYAIELYKRYGIPICDHACSECGLCNKSNYVGNSYLSPTTGISYAEKETKSKFGQF